MIAITSGCTSLQQKMYDPYWFGLPSLSIELLDCPNAIDDWDSPLNCVPLLMSTSNAPAISSRLGKAASNV